MSPLTSLLDLNAITFLLNVRFHKTHKHRLPDTDCEYKPSPNDLFVLSNEASRYIGPWCTRNRQDSRLPNPPRGSNAFSSRLAELLLGAVYHFAICSSVR